jgi:3-oxoadipate CoA-transferase beta subunit
MDLAIGARRTWVAMEHNSKIGQAKIVAECSCPLTGLACASRIHTDLAVLGNKPAGVHVRELTAADVDSGL